MDDRRIDGGGPEARDDESDEGDGVRPHREGKHHRAHPDRDEPAADHPPVADPIGDESGEEPPRRDAEHEQGGERCGGGRRDPAIGDEVARRPQDRGGLQRAVGEERREDERYSRDPHRAGQRDVRARRGGGGVGGFGVRGIR